MKMSGINNQIVHCLIRVRSTFKTCDTTKTMTELIYKNIKLKIIKH